MSASQRTAHYDEMNRVIAALHSTDYQALGLSDFGRAGNYLERQIGRWTKQYQASITDPIPAMDALIEWLPKHIPQSAHDDRYVSIVHGDYRMDNLVFDPLEPRIIAVLDWELSTLGHSLADFSYHCMSWHIRSSGANRGIGGLNLAELGIPAEGDYLRQYFARYTRGGLLQETHIQVLLQDWSFYLAYNLFRIGAILQGVAKRVVDGTASSTQAREAAVQAKPLAELGWQFAQQA